MHHESLSTMRRNSDDDIELMMLSPACGTTTTHYDIDTDVEPLASLPPPAYRRRNTTSYHTNTDIESLASSPPPAYEDVATMDPAPPAYLHNRYSVHAAYDASWLNAADACRQRRNALPAMTTPAKTRGFGNIVLLVVFAIVVAATIGGALADRRVKAKSVWA